MWSKQPWKNGRGVTHEIFRLTDPARARLGAGDYDLRLSVALIDGEQEFSLFPGYWRALVPLDDCALTLGAQPLLKHHVFELSGDEPTGTKGVGKTRDLNVISRIARARAHVVISTSEIAPHAQHLAAVALTPVTVRDPRGPRASSVRSTRGSSSTRA